MKRHWIEYVDEQPQTPMTCWVHLPVGHEYWHKAKEYNPPRQAVVPGRGYPLFKVAYNGFTFKFASLEEIQACIAMLSKRVLPRTIDLAENRSGPGSHWLSKLPSNVLLWRYREKAVKYLHLAMQDFKDNV